VSRSARRSAESPPDEPSPDTEHRALAVRECPSCRRAIGPMLPGDISCQDTNITTAKGITQMTDDRCSMCTRRIGPTVTGLCGYCVQHKCKPENADRIRAKRIAAERIREANAVAQWRANLERKYKPVVEQCQSARGRHGPPRGGRGGPINYSDVD